MSSARSGPAGPSRSARLGRPRHELLALHRERRRASSCACSTPTTTRSASRSPSAPRYNWHCYLPGVGPGQRYGYRVYGPYEPEEGHRFNPAKLLHRPVRQGDRGRGRLGRGQRAALRPRRHRRRRPRARRRGRRRRDPQVRSSSTTSFDWEDDRPPRHAVERDGHLRDARQGLHEAAPRRARGPARHLRRPGLRAGDRATSRSSASPRSSCCRSTTSPTRTSSSSEGLTNYWGYSSIGFLAPHAGYAATGAHRRAGPRVQGHGQGAAPGGHRGDPRRRLQPHRRGQPPRPDARPSRASTTSRYYRLMPDDPRFYMDFTGTGNSLNAVHPSVLRLIMDSLRYWVIECHVDGFRFDLASALARELYDVDRLPRVLRHDPPGPGPVAGQAHRRAVGRRPRRLPGRQLPGAVDGVERHLPRHDARLLARRRRASRDFASRLTGSSDLYEDDGRDAVRVDQLHHRPRRLHAAPTSSPTTRSTTRPTWRTTRTAPTTTARGTAASRARPTTPRSTRCARASSATS